MDNNIFTRTNEIKFTLDLEAGHNRDELKAKCRKDIDLIETHSWRVLLNSYHKSWFLDLISTVVLHKLQSCLLDPNTSIFRYSNFKTTLLQYVNKQYNTYGKRAYITNAVFYHREVFIRMYTTLQSMVVYDPLLQYDLSTLDDFISTFINKLEYNIEEIDKPTKVSMTYLTIDTFTI